jgi:nickel/cobalt transporter (NicO) family protein
VTDSAALIAAAAGVGFGHAILPDHWVPLAVVGRTQHYPVSKVARLSAVAGLAHVVVSLALGAVIVVIGLELRDKVQSAQDTIVGLLLIATGVGFLVLELTGHGHGHSHSHDDPHDHHDHDHDHDHDRRSRSLLAVIIPFGAAASPDLTILPVFLAATTAGAGTAVASLVVFAAVTIGTFVVLTVAATIGGYQLGGAWLDRWGNVFTALVLIVIGALVLAGVL